MNAITPRPDNSDYDADNRWRARLKLSLDNNGHRTRLSQTEHMGPLRIQRPFYPEGEDLPHLYLLHPPGGMVGGDEIAINIAAQHNAKALVTTPSAGKFYRNITALKQVQKVTINLSAGASIEYLPQENILFNGSQAQLITQVNLGERALYCGWEIISLGRHESGEPFTNGSLNQSLTIYRNQRPLFIDRNCLSAKSRLLTSMAGFQAAPVFGTLVICCDNQANAALAETIDNWRAALDSSEIKLGISQKPGVLIARCLAARAETARETFIQLWHLLRPEILARPACSPRIWNT